MLNKEVKVPDNTIAVFNTAPVSYDRLSNFLKKPSKKRDWFTSHFYRCLPLIIGNQYGFIIKSEFDFTLYWNGGPEITDTSIFVSQEVIDNNDLYPNISSHFGSGIITVNPPFILRTPPNVNLMTINPPNYILPNITVMTGVVETDNLRRNFTFNLKIQSPNVQINIAAGTPLAGFIPIPRYFADSFVLKDANELFNSDIIGEEMEAHNAANLKRSTIESKLKFGVGKDYYQGRDVYGNNFSDHQKP
jgi:hypothetical protein